MEVAKSGILGILLFYMIYSNQNNNATKADLKAIQSEHEELSESIELSTHFLWSLCVNSAKDQQEMNRCVPPITKVQSFQEQASYSIPSVATQPAASSSVPDHVNARESEQNASFQNQVRLQTFTQ